MLVILCKAFLCALGFALLFIACFYLCIGGMALIGYLMEEYPIGFWGTVILLTIVAIVVCAIN